MRRLCVYMMALLCLVASCVSNDDSSATQALDKSVSVQLIVSLGGGESTRATDASLDDAEGNEYYVNPNDVDILLYDADGRYVAKAQNVTAVRNTENTTAAKNVYTLTGKFVTASGLDLNGKYKFVVIANTNDSKCSVTRADDFNWNDYYYAREQKVNDDMVYSCSDNKSFTEEVLKSNLDNDDNTTRIPMWGKVTVENLSKVVAKTQAEADANKVSIDLMRAMAKVTVKCTDKNHTLEKVVLTGKINHNGYVAPANAADCDNTVATTDNKEYTKVLNIPTQEASTQDVEFVNADNKGTYYLFIPEQEKEATKMVVTVNGQDYYIYFSDYVNGSRDAKTEHAVVRNNWYEYVITSVEDKLCVDSKVLPWNVTESEIGWEPKGEMYAWKYSNNEWTYNATQGDEEARLCMVSYPRFEDSQHTAVKNASSGAAFSFKLSAPTGCMWKAHLTNQKDFTFNTSESSAFEYKDAEYTCATTGIARLFPYQIKVEATNPWWTVGDDTSDFDENNENITEEGKRYAASYENNGAGTYTDLYITVSLDGIHEYELVINPKNAGGKYKNDRKFCGTDTRIRIYNVKVSKNADYVKTLQESTYKSVYSKYLDIK